MDFISQILSVGIYATVAMTAFSYAFSYIFHSNFKEPQLLNYLIAHLPNSNLSLHREHVLGWVIHISIGCFFVTVFKILLLFYDINLSWVTGLVFGAIAGLIGIGVWTMMLNLHPDPPKIKRKTFYLQLFFAHLIFGIVMVFALGA